MSWEVSGATIHNAFGTGSISYSITEDSNQYLCVVLGSTDVRDSYFEIATFDGQSFTRVNNAINSSGDETSVDFIYFNISGKATGTYTFYYDVVFSAPDFGRLAMFTVKGGQSYGNPLNASATKTANSQAQNISITTTQPNSLVIDAFCNQRDPFDFSPGSGQTQIFLSDLNGSGYKFGASFKEVASPSTTTMSWSVTDYYAYVAGSFTPKVEGGAFLYHLL